MAIRPEELRIGNWVEDEGDSIPIQIVYITEDNTSWLNPIPLTPSILEKCGGERLRTPGGWFFNDLYLRFHWDKNDDINSTTIFSNGSEHSIAPKKYLHQLQNLFFALAGQELEYKP